MSRPRWNRNRSVSQAEWMVRQRWMALQRPVSENLIVALFGGKGKGKSTLAREVIRLHPRVTILDAHGEYGEDHEADPLLGCKHAWELDECMSLMLAVKDEKRFCISLREPDDGAALQLWPVLWEIPDQLIVIEEASRFCDPTRLPREVARVLRLGRHRSLSQLYIAQRPSAVHRDVTANADVIVAFRQQEPRDILYLRAVAGQEVERLRALPDYKVMAFGDLSKVPVPVLERIHQPAQRSLDLKPEGE